MNTTWTAFVAARLDDDDRHAHDQHSLNCRLFRGQAACNCDIPESIRDWCRVGRTLLDLHSDDPVTIAEMAWPYRRHPDYPGRTEATA